MICGMVPFKGRSLDELREAVLQGPLKYPDDVKKHISAEARHLIKIMLNKDPVKRATVAQVLKHPWLN